MEVTGKQQKKVLFGGIQAILVLEAIITDIALKFQMVNLLGLCCLLGLKEHQNDMLNTLKTLNLCAKYAILSLLSVYLFIHLLVVLIKVRLLKLPLLRPINPYIPTMQPLKLNPSLAQLHATFMLKKPYFSMFFCYVLQ